MSRDVTSSPRPCHRDVTEVTRPSHVTETCPESGMAQGSWLPLHGAGALLVIAKALLGLRANAADQFFIS